MSEKIKNIRDVLYKDSNSVKKVSDAIGKAVKDTGSATLTEAETTELFQTFVTDIQNNKSPFRTTPI